MDTTAASLPDHLAVPYSTPADLAERLAPQIDGVLAAGAPVLAVLGGPERAAVAATLGVGADRIEFADPARVHAVPAFTVAVRWARLARHAVAGRALVVGQHLDLPHLAPAHWVRLDAAVDVAIDGLPVRVLCPCPDDEPAVLATHPRLLTADGPHTSPGYRPPPEVLIDHPPPPPPDLGASDLELPFDAAALPGLRRRVAAAAGATGLDGDRVDDLVLAVNELATNSVEHGPGSGRLRLWLARGSVTAEVADRGRMDVPFPGLVRPSVSGARGRGLWLASELSDVLQVWSDATGTVIRTQIA